jgi:hypothetical protein
MKNPNTAQPWNLAAKQREEEILALFHQLGERLTAAGNYLAALRQLITAPPGRGRMQPPEMLERALSQLGEADELFHRLRQVAIRPERPKGDEPAAAPPGFATPSRPLAQGGGNRVFRVCFLNHLARADKTFTACQRSIVIPEANSREAAIEAAKKRFAEIEGIPSWRLHADTIEAGLIEVDTAQLDPPTAHSQSASTLQRDPARPKRPGR